MIPLYLAQIYLIPSIIFQFFNRLHLKLLQVKHFMRNKLIKFHKFIVQLIDFL